MESGYRWSRLILLLSALSGCGPGPSTVPRDSSSTTPIPGVVPRPGTATTTRPGLPSEYFTPVSFLAHLVHAAPGAPDATIRLFDPAATASSLGERTVGELRVGMTLSDDELPEYVVQIEVEGQVIYQQTHAAEPFGTILRFAVVHGPTAPEAVQLPDYEPPGLYHRAYAVNAVSGGPDLQFALDGAVFDEAVVPPGAWTSILLDGPPYQRSVQVDLLSTPGGPELTALGEFPDRERSTVFATDLPPWEGAPDTLIQWPEFPGYTDVLVVLQP